RSAEWIKNSVSSCGQKRLNQAFHECDGELCRVLEPLFLGGFLQIAPDADRVLQPLLAVEVVAAAHRFPCWFSRGALGPLHLRHHGAPAVVTGSRPRVARYA